MAMPIAIQMSFIEAQIQATLERHKDILLARAYHEGIQPIYLTDRQKEYLDLHSDNQFCLNVTRLVTTALCDELNIVGFETNETADENGVKAQAAWLWDIWNKNHMDARQGDVHEKTVSESESFIILDWDEVGKYPVIVFHERFTDGNAEAWEGKWSDLSMDTMERMKGTGTGVWMIYENDDPNQKAIAAVQQWPETTYDKSGKMNSRIRRTIYYPDRIARYFYNERGEWEEMENSPRAWIGKEKKPLGIPVIHFKNKNMRPEAWDAIPLNDAINKTWVDILGSADLSGYPLFILLGLYPTTDGKPPAADNSNVWNIGPAQMLGNAGVKSGEASVSKFEGSDPTPLMETLKDQIMFVAQITGTPASRFITTAQVSSADSLKEQERALRKRAYNRQILFGDAWEDVMIMARRIANAFGNAGMDENVSIKAVWKNLTTVDDLKTEQGFGVPEEIIWAAMGKSPDQIAAMKDTQEYKIRNEKAIWEGYAAASSNGVTVEAYLKRIGMSDKKIAEITADMGAESVPPTEM